MGVRLDRLEADGYAVFHDLGVPRSRANVDHLVIGPNGVYLIEARNYTGRVTLSNRTLWHGRYPITKTVATTGWETQRVGEVLSPLLSPLHLRVRTVMCVIGAELPKPVMDVEGVRIVSGGRRLVQAIKAGPDRLTPEAVCDLTELAERRLRAAGAPSQVP